MKKTLTLVVAGILLAAVPAALAADNKKQEVTTRSVQGVVTDGSDQGLEGAVVQLKDTKTLQIRSFITKANGQYQFHGLNPNIDYELKAEHQGASSGTKTLSSFDSGRSAVLNLRVEKK